MSTLESILDLLNRWPSWKRITDSPDRIDGLEHRVAQLEDKLQRAPGEACPSCGALAFRVTESKPMAGGFGKLGVRQWTRRCDDCEFEDTETRES